MILGILGAGGHAKSVYDIVKKKRFIFLIKQKKNLKLVIRSTMSLVTMML